MFHFVRCRLATIQCPRHLAHQLRRHVTIGATPASPFARTVLGESASEKYNIQPSAQYLRENATGSSNIPETPARSSSVLSSDSAVLEAHLIGDCDPKDKSVLPEIENGHASKSACNQAVAESHWKPKRPRFYLLDLETTGYSIYYDRIIQIASAPLAGYAGTGFNAFVKPKNKKISTKITQLTGITAEQAQSSPDIETVLDDFIQWLAEDLRRASQAAEFSYYPVLLAHNGSRFDAPLMYLEMRRARILGARVDKLGLNFADTFTLFTKLRKEKLLPADITPGTGLKLSSIYLALFPSEDATVAEHHHNAEKDIYFLGRILHRLQEIRWWDHIDVETFKDLSARVAETFQELLRGYRVGDEMPIGIADAETERQLSKVGFIASDESTGL